MFRLAPKRERSGEQCRVSGLGGCPKSLNSYGLQQGFGAGCGLRVAGCGLRVATVQGRLIARQGDRQGVLFLGCEAAYPLEMETMRCGNPGQPISGSECR